MVKAPTYAILGVLGLFVIGGLFLYAFPLQTQLKSWPDEPLTIYHLYPAEFAFDDYAVADSLTDKGQFSVTSGGQWTISPKDADAALFSEVFKLGYGVRVEKDEDNWREGTVSGASFIDATESAPAYFSVTLTGETTDGTLAAGDTVTVKSQG